MKNNMMNTMKKAANTVIIVMGICLLAAMTAYGAGNSMGSTSGDGPAAMHQSTMVQSLEEQAKMEAMVMEDVGAGFEVAHIYSGL